MKLTVTVDDCPPVVAYLNDDVKITHGGGDFAITATYPTYDVDELIRRREAGERIVPVEIGAFQ